VKKGKSSKTLKQAIKNYLKKHPKTKKYFGKHLFKKVKVNHNNKQFKKLTKKFIKTKVAKMKKILKKKISQKDI